MHSAASITNPEGLTMMEMDQKASPTLDELWALVRRQRDEHQAEIALLREQIKRQESQLQEQRQERLVLASWEREPEDGETPEKRRVSRAGLIKSAAVGVAGLAGVEALRPQTVLADNGQSVILGQDNSESSITSITTTSGITDVYALLVDASNGNSVTAIQGAGGGNGDGVYGNGGNLGGNGVTGFSGNMGGYGVLGRAQGQGAGANAGVVGQLGTPTIPDAPAGVIGVADGTGTTGVYAYAQNGVGLFAASDSGFGVHAVGFPGFLAEGAIFNGAHGRGGRFVSQQAQIRLNPASSSTPPATGQAAGDFFVDSNGGLHYYNGTSWKTLA